MSQPSQPITQNPTSPQPTSTPAPSAPPAITSVGRSGGRLPKLQLQAAYQALASGLQSTYQPTDNFNIHGETLSRDEVVARLHDVVATVEATKAARQQWRSALQAEHASVVTGTALRQSLQGVLQARLGGKAASELATFGFNPFKTGKRTVAGKATAVAKGAATRQARHTLGSVQKLAIKGDVVGITVTPSSPPRRSKLQHRRDRAGQDRPRAPASNRKSQKSAW